MKTNGKWNKALAVALAASLVCTGTGLLAYAAGSNSQASDAQTVSAAQTDVKPAGPTDGGSETRKDETVYVLASADGSINKIIVGDWVRNPGSGSLNDRSSLSDVENVSGDESCVMDGDELRVWDAQGQDICYRGTADRELPVKMAVSYTLDGKSVAPEELSGKNGRVCIRFDYENTQTQTVQISGKDEQLKVPFVMLTGLLLDDAKFSDVQVSNGRIINDGDRCIVVGFALPGLQEDLALDPEQLELPDYVEITADVTDFSLDGSMTFAVGDLFADLDLDDSALGDVSSSLTKLTDAMTELTDGSSRLYDGLNTLLNKSDALIDGIDHLADGAKTLSDGSTALRDATTQLADGASSLSTGASTLDDGAAALDDGAKRLSDGTQSVSDGASKLNESIGTLASGAKELYTKSDELAGGAGELSHGLHQLSANSTSLNSGASAISDAVFETATAQLRAALVSGGMDAAQASQITLTLKNYDTTIAGVFYQQSGVSFDQAQGAAEAQLRGGLNNAGIADAATQNLAMYIACGLYQDQTCATVSAAVNAAGAMLADTQTVQAAYAAYGAQLGTNPALGQMVGVLTAAPYSLDEQTAAMVACTACALDSANPAGQLQTASGKAVNAGKVQAAQTAMTAEQSAAAAKLNALYTAAIYEQNPSARELMALKTQLDGVNTFVSGLKTYTGGVDDAASGASSVSRGCKAVRTALGALSDGAFALHDGSAALKSGAGDLATGAQSLYSGLHTLRTGADTLRAGAAALSDGARQLRTGAAALADGAKTLSAGTKELQSKAPALKDGVTALRDGAGRLSDGLNQLNEEGIQKIVDLYDGDLAALGDRLRAIADVSADYRNYSGISEDMEGSVRFIYKTDSIGD